MPGIEVFNRTCECGSRPHEPVIGKERSKKSAQYRVEFCTEYGKPAAKHFRNIAKWEFSQGRLQLLENRIQRVKKVTNDLLVEAHGSHPEVK